MHSLTILGAASVFGYIRSGIHSMGADVSYSNLKRSGFRDYAWGRPQSADKSLRMQGNPVDKPVAHRRCINLHARVMPAVGDWEWI